ncbi:transcriptional attenuator, LytR family [Alkalicoccus daliensis]|uniref:Transcriptional attenuator, LytR family n=1 Tax=Alkalicoccus daliensis TaxID=745820 RepID=A0A1H0GHE1_9BACI|nr:LCP family protein [Alkalicoccus daliensis]SDO06365.1 transcriptional attenuator, LytR family [Alkalicoccus daliensis]
MSELSRSDRQPKRRSPFRRFLKFTMIVVLMALIITGGVAGYMVYQVQSAAKGSHAELERGEKSDLRADAVNPGDEPVSVLFLGLDSREDDLSGRTDAMILATFNPEDKSIKMVNIPRDSYVNIPDKGTNDKINHAHAFGGVPYTINTVEQMLDVPVDYVVSLNFLAFMEIVDTIGGVEVDVPMPISDTDNATYGSIEIEEGMQTLNGEEALAYARMRKQDPRGDLGRGDRQKDIIEAVVRQSASFSTITRFDSLLDSLERNLSTNLTFGNMVSMHSYAGELNDIESLTFEGDDSMENGVYYYKIRDASLAEVSSTLKEHLEIGSAGTAAE